jgi:hypothetical protein
VSERSPHSELENIQHRHSVGHTPRPDDIRFLLGQLDLAKEEGDVILAQLQSDQARLASLEEQLETLRETLEEIHAYADPLRWGEPSIAWIADRASKALNPASRPSE